MIVKKRRVRVHFTDQQTTVEGIQVARTRSDLILEVPQVLETQGDKQNSIDLKGRLAIPRDRILFTQLL